MSCAAGRDFKKPSCVHSKSRTSPPDGAAGAQASVADNRQQRTRVMSDIVVQMHIRESRVMQESLETICSQLKVYAGAPKDDAKS